MRLRGIEDVVLYRLSPRFVRSMFGFFLQRCMKIRVVSKMAIAAFLTWVLVISSFANANQRIALIQPTVEYAVTISVSATTIGSTITLNWTAPEGHPVNDYIRLARKASADSEYQWSQNLGSATSGTFNVPVPSSVDRYEFRLFRGTDNIRIAQSLPFVANKPDYSVSVNPIQIAASGQITVTWESPEGRPINDQIVIVQSNNSALAAQQYTGGVNPRLLRFDAPSTPGDYEARYLEANGQYSAMSQLFTVTPAEGWFAGRVRNGDSGEYIAGGLVEVLQQGSVKASSVTNSNGGYNIPLSVIGTYDLRVTADGFPPALRADVVLTSGNTTEVNVDLTIKGAIAGTISKAGSGTPIAGATVRLLQGATTVSSKVNNQNGSYDFTQLLPGTYSIEVQAAGFNSLTQGNLNVAAGETINVNLSLIVGQQGTGNNLEYIYDDSGRLVAVKEQGILTKLYEYDLTGNLLSISSPPATAPAIIGFSPRSGLPGTTVIIRGINFGGAAGQNTVSFNGVAATVLLYSPTELVVTVPASATTGPISVTSPGGSVTSNSAFVVGTDQTNQPPSVTGFSPTVGHSGDIVTIYGANFESDPVDNDVRFGATGSPVNSAASTSLVVSAATSSGKISVTTPYGTSTSQNEFISVPSSVDITKVDPRGRTWFGHTKHIGIVGSDRRAAYVFEGFAGKRISLKLLYLTGGVNIEIFRPDGRLLTSRACYPSLGKDSWFIDSTTTPFTGTYTIIATPPQHSRFVNELCDSLI